MYFFDKKSVIGGCLLFLLVRSSFSVDPATGRARGRLKGVTVDRTIFFALDSHLYFVQELANLTMNVKYSPLLLRGTSNSVLVTRNHKYSSQL